ncbi:MAG: fasciclin domain-containing protein [Bacteroidales bacterium]|nr:fasciclin domain-containing protein [Bacteroidales bacterium]
MTKQTLLRIGAGMSLSLAMTISLNSCQDDISDDSHYKTPDFLVGNAIEVLQQSFEGNSFKTFLRGIELIGYSDVVDSQILTVLAPTDEAFAKFLQEKGYASIDEMYYADPTLTKQVITYHLLYYAMDWSKMTNFRPTEGDAATEEDKAVRAGMYNRFRTRCCEDAVQVVNTDATIDAEYITVVHFDRYLTVFSEQMFATLGIDAASNYNYFFPDTEWNPKHLANGFNVMNAAVLDTVAVVTDNGYLYHIDHVIEPVGTIYEELKSRDNYQLVANLFDQFDYYHYEETESTNRGYSVYSHRFKAQQDSLPNIDMEWAIPSYTAFSTNSMCSWNLFIPTDDAFTRMFNEYWEEGCGYSSVETLNPLIQNILLNECLNKIIYESSSMNYMCYPDNIRQGKAQSRFGNVLSADPASYDVNVVCNNGVIYGSSSMEVPGVFNSVAGPAFKDVKYLPYLYALNGAGVLLSLSSQQSQFITLIPDTAQFSNSDPKMRLARTVTSGIVSYELQQWDDTEGGYTQLGSSTCQDMANMNTSTDATSLKTSGIQVVETNATFNYWFVKDGKITTNALFNEQLDAEFNGEIWYPFHEIKASADGTASWSNGKAYAYEYPSVYMPVSGGSLQTELSERVNSNYPYSCFVQLLQKAGLAANSKFAGLLTLDSETRFFAIVPTNDAIKEALTTLPGCSKAKISDSYVISGSFTKADLANYLLSYFVTSSSNVFTAYPYPGSSCNGTFLTDGDYNLVITDNGESLSANFVAKEKTGSITPEEPVGTVVQLDGTYDYLPFVFSDGAIQLIDTVLK